MQKRILNVYSNNRAVRDFYINKNPLKNTDNILDSSVAMSALEFFQHCFYVKDAIKINKNIQNLLLCNIIKKKQFNRFLAFDSTFVAYLESSSFLVDFFNELDSHNVSINNISLKDIYAEYVEHLNILESIYNDYKNELDSRHFNVSKQIDKIEFINEFITSFDEINYFLDGFLTPFEEGLLEIVASLRELKIHIKTDRYFKSTNECYSNFKMLDLKENYYYIIDYKNKQILESNKLDSNLNATAYKFELRINQAAFILDKVQTLLNNGISPDKIAIITPDKDFRKILKAVDEFNLLDYAMGEEFITSKYFSAFNTIIQEADSSPIELLSAMKEYVLDSNLPKNTKENLIVLFESYESLKADIANLELNDFKTFVEKDLESISLDDLNSGSVRVIEILETRGLEFDAIFIADFNDEFIPNKKDSDLFLNSTIRKYLNMPTMNDKANLQKHYYFQALKNAKQAFITFSENEDSIPSFMLNECNIEIKNGDDEVRLFKKADLKTTDIETIMQNTPNKAIPKEFTFSATSFDCFNTCNLKFYLKYIQKLKAPETTNDSRDYGELLHNILKEEYSKFLNQTINENMILEIKKGVLGKIWQETKKEKFNYAFIKNWLDSFFENEIERSKNTPFSVIYLEEEFNATFNGINIAGKIDRIDKVNDDFLIIDYKFQNLEKQNDKHETQLWFYQTLLECCGFKQHKECAIYALKNNNKSFIDVTIKKYDELKESLNSTKTEKDFPANPSKDNCKYCDYQTICKR